ncbi:hypothetical protein NO976_04432 (plasmid) [Planktothrix agardhii]|jgi:hypothetical protein|uniref:hypothetical protein n=1 Tax=Planktothrix agardhii TaxID=1160 RepID=UPI0020A6EE26|nr:hypothetical protein [Planktothrix agardhii]CAD5984513.1 hypothetical protein NO976_04432 [Planktothrix agardhii]
MQGMIVRTVVDVIVMLAVYGLFAGIKNPWNFIQGKEKVIVLTKTDWFWVWVIRIITLNLVNAAFFLTYLDQYPYQSLLFLSYRDSVTILVYWGFFSSVHHLYRYLTRYKQLNWFPPDTEPTPEPPAGTLSRGELVKYILEKFPEAKINGQNITDAINGKSKNLPKFEGEYGFKFIGKIKGANRFKLL